jgi:histidyl-tRNA synthetase
MGDVVITLLLQKNDLLPKNLIIHPASVLVTVFDQEMLLASFKLAAELRRTGLKVAVYPETAKLPKQFKYADKIKARVALVLGPDEIANNQVTIKDLSTGNQQTVLRVDAAKTIRQQVLESKSG